MIYNNQIVEKMDFNTLKSSVKSVNYRILEKGGDHIDEITGLKLKELNHYLLTEFNFKSYEEKLDKKNRPHLGPISRMKYNKLKELSEAILPNNVFTSKERFSKLNKILINNESI